MHSLIHIGKILSLLGLCLLGESHGSVNFNFFGADATRAAELIHTTLPETPGKSATGKIQIGAGKGERPEWRLLAGGA
jgi:hypothetical protein